MGYAARNELKNRLGTSVFNEIYASSDSMADADLESASAEIDGSISVRYALPVTGNGNLLLLKDWCLTLAEERAFSRCAGSDWTEKIKGRTAQVRLYLEMIRDGRYRLVGTPERAGGIGDGFVQITSSIFGRENMKGF